MPGLFLLANLLVSEELLDPVCIIQLPVFWFCFKAFKNFRSKNGFFYGGIQEGWLYLEIHKWWAFWGCSSSFKCLGKHPVGQKSTESNNIMAVCLNPNQLFPIILSVSFNFLNLWQHGVWQIGWRKSGKSATLSSFFFFYIIFCMLQVMRFDLDHPKDTFHVHREP